MSFKMKKGNYAGKWEGVYLQPGLPGTDGIPALTPEAQAVCEPHVCRVLGACLLNTGQLLFPRRGAGPLCCRRFASLASNPEKSGLPVPIPAPVTVIIKLPPSRVGPPEDQNL